MNNYSWNHVKFIHSGKEFFELLVELIDNAYASVHLQTYIFNDDLTGTQVADALIRAAARKVTVYVLADGYASQELPAEFIKKLKTAGVHFRFFEPLFASKNFYFGRRLHHKVVVIDGFRALVGGMNIADRYNEVDGQQSWFDAALFVEGELSAKLYGVCSDLWNGTRSRRRSFPEHPHAHKIKPIEGTARHLLRIRRNDWVNRRHEIRRTYAEFFRQADESITIVCSYFLPGNKFRKQLKRALKRGVTIKVVLTGLSDVRIAKYAERFLYRWMLRNKIILYEYRPTVLHAKIAIADNQKMTLGSYNINNISEFVSIELNLDVDSRPFVENVQKEIDETIKKDCVQIMPSTYKTSILNQLLQWASFHFIRLLLTLTTFYFRQTE